MKTIRIDESHVWEKQNTITVHSSRGGYDKLRCVACGAIGKRYKLDTVEVSDKYEKCPNAKIPVLIRIRVCTAFGKAFANLGPGTIHAVVSSENGIWVMGAEGEPVRLLPHEFEVEQY